MPSYRHLLLHLFLLTTCVHKVKSAYCVYDDVSDNAAILDKSTIYCINVPESSPVGNATCVFRVQNATYISASTYDQVFLYNTLETQENSDNSITVRLVQSRTYSDLVDSDNPPSASTISDLILCYPLVGEYIGAALYVDIETENTQKPLFMENHYIYSDVPEIWPIGKELSIEAFGVPIYVEDRDNTFGNTDYAGSRIIIEIQDGSEEFAVSYVYLYKWPYTYSAAIYPKIDLDYQVQSVYQFTLLAKNVDGNPVQQSAVNVTIALRDLDTLNPIFTASYYSTSVEETLITTPGTYNLTTNPDIEAYDQDTGINQTLTYSINTDCGESWYCDIVKSHFDINNSTGELTFISNGTWPYDTVSISFLILARQTDDLDKVATSEVIATFELPASLVENDTDTN